MHGGAFSFPAQTGEVTGYNRAPTPGARASPVTANILDGKAVAAKQRQTSASRAAEFTARFGRPPGLAVVKVGEDPASAVYVRNKRKACEECGIASFAHDLPATTTREQLLRLVRELNADDRVDGILLQLPLPKGLDSTEIMDTIDPAKDVDGFHPTNTGLLAQKRPGLRPCTPWGVITLAQEYRLDLTGLRACVVGASNIVGRPMALELLLARATVTVCHTGTRDLRAEVERAELVVAAVGKPAYIPGDWIREGAIVMDVGINRGADGKLVGDVEFARAAERASWITPVPGGIGPMTIAMLLSNTVDAALARKAGRSGEVAVTATPSA
jgi:methylenetetrahydrofolate dehydrogenase (NADP+) / methenyltetrahydrofolate cyclohydrolase